MAYPDWKTTPHSQNLIASIPEDASLRKYRLLGVACCRLIWPLLDPRSRHAVEATERRESARVGLEARRSEHAQVLITAGPAATDRPSHRPIQIRMQSIARLP